MSFLKSFAKGLTIVGLSALLGTVVYSEMKRNYGNCEKELEYIDGTIQGHVLIANDNQGNRFISITDTTEKILIPMIHGYDNDGEPGFEKIQTIMASRYHPFRLYDTPLLERVYTRVEEAGKVRRGCQE